VEFGVDQMDLPEIRLVWIARDARAVLDGDPRMRIIRNAKPFKQVDRRLIALRQRMCCTATYCREGVS